MGGDLSRGPLKETLSILYCECTVLLRGGGGQISSAKILGGMYIHVQGGASQFWGGGGSKSIPRGSKSPPEINPCTWQYTMSSCMYTCACVFMLWPTHYV